MNVGMITCTYYMRIYGYQNQPSFNWGEMCKKWRAEFHYDDFLALAREIRAIGFNSMEIWEPMFSFRVYTTDDAKRLAADLKAMGFVNLAYCVGGFTGADKDIVEPAYRLAQALGAKVCVGCLDKAGAEDILPTLQAMGEKYDMLYAIENHPEPNVEKPEDVARLAAKYSRVGANIDTGIYNMQGYDVLAAADLLKDKIYHVHFKDSPRGGEGCLPIGDADTPCAALMKKLAGWNYQYMLSVEYEFPTNPLPGLYKSMGYINGVLDTLALEES